MKENLGNREIYAEKINIAYKICHLSQITAVIWTFGWHMLSLWNMRLDLTQAFPKGVNHAEFATSFAGFLTKPHFPRSDSE